MLRIYSVALEMVREVRVLADRIQQSDRDHARQLRRSCMSVPLNLSEGSAARDGRRRNRYTDALGSARETLANLEVAEAVGYIRDIDPELRRRLDHIIGTLVRNLY
jgi:four helix bundle protein